MNTTRHNIAIDDAECLFRTMLSRSPAATLSLRAAYQCDDDGSAQFILGKCSPADATLAEQRERYPKHLFIAKRLADDLREDLITVLSGDGVELDADLPRLRAARSPSSITEMIVPSHATRTGTPMRRLFVPVSDNAQFRDSKLLTYDLPYRDSAQTYVAEFLALDDFHGHSDSNKGKLIIELSDQRGAICIDAGRVSIRGEEDLRLLGRVDDDEPIALAVGEETTIDVESAEELELWLVDRNNRIIDYRSSSEWPYPYFPAGPETADRAALLALIERGESEHCEFKPFINLSDRYKSDEIEKTVCAFSNSRGGTVFLGVDDEGKVSGIAPDAERHYSAEADNAVNQYVSAVRKRLRERLKDNQCFAIDVVTLYESLVVTITVSPIAGVNYLQHSQSAYMRRGATNRRLSPDDLVARVTRPIDY